MDRKAAKRTTLVFLLLVALTCFSWEAVQGTTQDRYQHAAGVTAVVLAFIKTRFIMMEFMELRHAPVLFRLASQAWIVVVGLGVIAMLIAGPSLPF